ncbi:MAG TPA: GNAT family N-acetyltransferase [Puia sp.]|jgi:GNAT superfamily N-acetyltransferase|nr:GNAT family N-acetyltransferase [Puia sp.]
MNWYKENFIISDEKEKLNAEYIHDYLSKKSYWAENIPLETVKKSIDGSICFGMCQNEKQIGFARVVTDKATFGYLADVFIDEDYRGKGLSKWMMEIIMAYPELQGLRRWMLGTRDAHELYSKFGFEPLENPNRVMHIYNADVYKKQVGSSE